MSILTKVAEAMDYLEANGIDPVGAFTIAANVGEDGQIADEKVASVVAQDGFSDADFQKIAEAVNYVGGITPEVAQSVLLLAKEAEAVEAPQDDLTTKVAEAMDYLDSHGIDPIGGLILAANVGEDGQIADEKVASVVAQDGFSDADFQKIAEAVQHIGAVDEQVINTAATLYKQAEYNATVEKVAEAMDYLASNGIDPIGAFTIAVNVDENGNVSDEKVASAIAEFSEEQLDKVAEAVDYIGGINPETAAIALELAGISA